MIQLLITTTIVLAIAIVLLVWAKRLGTSLTISKDGHEATVTQHISTTGAVPPMAYTLVQDGMPDAAAELIRMECGMTQEQAETLVKTMQGANPVSGPKITVAANTSTSVSGAVLQFDGHGPYQVPEHVLDLITSGLAEEAAHVISAEAGVPYETALGPVTKLVESMK